MSGLTHNQVLDELREIGGTVLTLLQCHLQVLQPIINTTSKWKQGFIFSCMKETLLFGKGVLMRLLILNLSYKAS